MEVCLCGFCNCELAVVLFHFNERDAGFRVEFTDSGFDFEVTLVMYLDWFSQSDWNVWTGPVFAINETARPVIEIFTVDSTVEHVNDAVQWCDWELPLPDL